MWKKNQPSLYCKHIYTTELLYEHPRRNMNLYNSINLFQNAILRFTGQIVTQLAVNTVKTEYVII